MAGLVPEPTNNLLLMDGDLHSVLRRLVTPYLTRSTRLEFRRSLEVAGEALVRSLVESSEVDLIADLAEPLVLEGIMSAMGVRHARRPKLGELARGMLGLLEPELPPTVRRHAANAALRATMLFERDAINGEATGLHAALEAAAQKGRIPVKAARSTPVVVLHGGYENPLNQLGCVIAWAVSNPRRFRDAALSSPALLFEEILRTFSPVRLVARWSVSDRRDGDLPVKKGEFVWVDLQSANLDEARFPAAGAVDLSKSRGHLGFGYGRHACPGAALARLEGQVLIQALLKVPPEMLCEFRTEWRDGVVARGPMMIVRR